MNYFWTFENYNHKRNKINQNIKSPAYSCKQCDYYKIKSKTQIFDFYNSQLSS